MLFEPGLDVYEAATYRAVEARPHEMFAPVAAVLLCATADGQAVRVLLWGGFHADGRQVTGTAQDVDHLEVTGEAVGCLGLIAVDGLGEVKGCCPMLTPVDMSRAIVYIL